MPELRVGSYPESAGSLHTKQTRVPDRVTAWKPRELRSSTATAGEASPPRPGFWLKDSATAGLPGPVGLKHQDKDSKKNTAEDQKSGMSLNKSHSSETISETLCKEQNSRHFSNQSYLQQDPDILNPQCRLIPKGARWCDEDSDDDADEDKFYEVNGSDVEAILFGDFLDVGHLINEPLFFDFQQHDEDMDSVVNCDSDDPRSGSDGSNDEEDTTSSRASRSPSCHHHDFDRNFNS